MYSEIRTIHLIFGLSQVQSIVVVVVFNLSVGCTSTGEDVSFAPNGTIRSFWVHPYFPRLEKFEGPGDKKTDAS